MNAARIAQRQLLNTHTRYLHDNGVQWAERLRALFPVELDTSVFTCTGSEANDVALRMAQAGRTQEALAWLPTLQRLAPQDPVTRWLAQQA